MLDVSGHWIPREEEDGNERRAVPLLVVNVKQRLRELRTRREDEKQEIPVAEARKRLMVVDR